MIIPKNSLAFVTLGRQSLIWTSDFDFLKMGHYLFQCKNSSFWHTGSYKRMMMVMTWKSVWAYLKKIIEKEGQINKQYSEKLMYAMDFKDDGWPLPS